MGKLAEVEAFWQSYLRSLPEDQRRNIHPIPEAWGFGDGREMADELGMLVYEGIKTATCSLLWEYEAEGETPPQVGDLSIILDGSDDPICMIETTEVEIKPYDQVDARFAYDEGEGDRSLSYWRKAHWRFFSWTCKQFDLQPRPDMPLVCERFRVLFKGPKN